MTNKVDPEYEKLDHSTHRIVSDVQLRKYGKFLEEYGSQLQSVEEALEDYVCDAWDMTLDPILLQFAAYEDNEILDLIVSENTVVNKVLKVFSTLCYEVDYLTKEAWTKFFDTILYYGEGSEEETKPDGESQIKLSQLLPEIHAIWCWIKRAGVVCEQIICQLNALYSARREKRRLFGGSDLHFQDVVEHLSDLLVTLITFDEIFQTQDTLRSHWKLFRRMLKSVKHDASSVGISAEKLQDLDDLLSNYETDLFSGAIFQTALHQMVSSVSKKHVTQELTGFVRSALGELDGRPVEVQDADHLLRWVKLAALFALDVNLTGSVDKKMMRQLWDFHKKIPSVTLYANVVWFPEKFLASIPQLAKFVDKKAEQQVISSRATFLQTKNASLSKEVHNYGLQVCCWMVQLEAALRRESVELKTDDLNLMSSLLLQGVQLACAMGRLVRNMMNLHVALERPMSRSSVFLLCRLIELLQAIKSMYHRHSVKIAQSTAHIVQHNLYQVLTIINTVKKNHVQNRRSSERYADVLSAFALVENALNGPMTRERRLIARLSLSMASQGKSFRDEEHINVLRLLRRLDAVCDLQTRLFAACDCSFLYWHRVILSTYFSGLYENKTALHRLSYILFALRDCVVTMHRDANNNGALESFFEKEVTSALEKQILRPLCHDIETSLRLSVHSHLQLDERNPFTTYLPDFAPLVKLRPMRFFDKYIDIKGFVEHHLDQTFYNLTTVALHDWRTYGEMRSLAKHKYSLETVEDHLPSQTLEQGLDVLEIMRNIHIFVSKYLYNLNNQIFIEQSSNNKHLNTINIRHVANSIRTHGTGIMNTTVNFTYQFLRKKFFIFSQFMYDEHIKSRLLKDLRFFRENKTNLNQMYSYERAHKFNRGIRKLGVTPQGDSFLDQFRVLISQIGNAMGYVRMIRSGGLHCCSNAICFVPDLEDVANFESLCVEQGLSESCRSAARHLDQVIGNLGRNFAEGTEYFKLLVNVFQTEFNKAENIHLRNFHAIVPPLTINFVEHSISCKEQLNKKNKNDAAFTDDGFAMGVAYILTVLGLQAEWDALHWFDSVRAKYAKDKATLKSQRQTIKGSEDQNLQHTMTLTGRRLEMYQQEFDLLYYSLSSARIFFQKEEKSIGTEAPQSQQTPVPS